MSSNPAPHAVPQGGWYLLQGALDGPDARAVQARCRDSAGNEHRVALGSWRGGAPFELVLPLPPGWSEFELLDERRGPLPCTDLRLSRLSRRRATWRMMAARSTAPGDAGVLRLLASLAGVAGIAMTSGVLRALQEIALRYRARVFRPGRVLFACDVRSRRNPVDAAAWAPVHGLEVVVEAGTVELEATDDDPQLRLERMGTPLRFDAGWYALDARFAIRSGRMIAPALYPDYGEGCRAADMIGLPEPGSDGTLRTLVLLKQPVQALRLDPSVRRLRFSIEHCSLRRVGRVEALWRLLEARGGPSGARDWTSIAGSIARYLVDVARHGIPQATAALHQREASTDGADYTAWVRRYDTIGRRDVAGFEARAKALEGAPLVSVLLPTYNTPDRFLKRCIASVLAQAYRNWELCIVDDASTSPHVWRTLTGFASRDPRIRIQRRTRNGHIAAASNDALAMARGEYVALLDHDDELRPHALLEMMEAAQRAPGAGLLYSDEDKIDERGRRFQPNFKPDWNPDLLLSQNYVCHLSVLRTGLARAAGGFRVGYEGSQDHDLLLRCTASLHPDQIVHVPKVLYHWRAIKGSTALEREAKDYAADAGLRAVADHLRNTAPGATAEHLAHGHYRVRWPLDGTPAVEIIVPTRDRLELIRPCVESILALTDYDDYRIVLVDNQSTEPATLAWMQQVGRHPRVRVVGFDAPFNFSAINNRVAAASRAEVLCLLNNDIEVVEAGWLRELASQAMRPGIGAVGAMLYYPDRTIQHAGVILGMGGVANHVYAGAPQGYPGLCARALVAQNLSAVTAACMAIKRERYLEVGGLDERLQVAFNDVDFCLRLFEAGYRNVWTPFAELLHHESATRGRDEEGPGRERFLGEARYMDARWSDLLHADPAWNPNLSLDDLDGSLAFPPRAATRIRLPRGDAR